MTPQAHLDNPLSTMLRHFWFAALIAGCGVLAILAASIDPWLLVMMVGVALTTLAIYDRADPHWYAL